MKKKLIINKYITRQEYFKYYRVDVFEFSTKTVLNLCNLSFTYMLIVSRLTIN